ncbi:MAG: response regulator [Methyloligellaceae bacterium]
MQGTATQPLNILIADDSAVVRRCLGQWVQGAPVPVSTVEVADGDACRKELIGGQFDIAFVDVHMPGSSGLDAIAESREAGVATFVVVVSANSEAERLEVARALDVYEYLAKPFEERDVVAIIENYMRFQAPTSVLVVDDSKAVRRVIGKVLGDSIFNLQIEDVEDGTSALVAYKARRHDIVFLDANMPGLHGIETLQMLQQLNTQVKVALITADRSTDLANSFRRLGVHAMLYKPFYAKDVDLALHGLFGLRLPSLGTGADQAEAEDEGEVVPI